jgi:hypothetical protein
MPTQKVLSCQLTPTLTEYVLLTQAVGKDDSEVVTFKHPKYGDYYLNKEEELCYIDGEPWDLSTNRVYHADNSLLRKLEQSPDKVLFATDGYFFVDRVHAEEYQRSEPHRGYLVSNYTV